jgi:hypothetical protein
MMYQLGYAIQVEVMLLGWLQQLFIKISPFSYGNMNLYVGIAAIDRTGFVGSTDFRFCYSRCHPITARALFTAM